MRGALAIACVAIIAASWISCAAPGVESSNRPRNELANLACRFEADDWAGEIGVTALGDEPVAYVDGAKARLDVLAGALVSEGILQLEREGSILQGQPGEPAVYLRHPTVLAEVLHPYPYDGDVRGMRRGVLSVSFEDKADGWDTTLAQAPVFELSCEAFQLEVAEWRPEQPDLDRLQEWVHVGPGVVPFSASPGGAPKLAPRYDEASPARQFDRQGDWVLILWGALWGWVPESTVRRGEELTYGTCGGAHSVSGGAVDFEIFTCPTALPLFVERGGVRARLGTIAAGTEIEVHDDEHGGSTVSLDWIHPGEGARLLIPGLREASCASSGIVGSMSF